MARRPDDAVTIADVPASAAGMAAGLAATIALETMGRATTGGTIDHGPRHPISRAYQAARYVFTTIRGRMDAEERRRHLVAETDGARRMAEGTLVEIGQTVLAQGITHPELQALVDSLIKQRARRDTVSSDQAAAEKFQASEDLRLGLLESAAENEWKSCAEAAREAELALGRNEAEKREAREALAKHHAARIAGGPPPASDRATLDHRLAELDAQYRALRERAAALRASTLAAKTRLEQATANRRQAAAAVSASVAGHTRERGELDADIRTLTTRIGLAALEQRVPSPFLTAAYERFDRLQATARGHQTELARIERSKGGIDRPRFAAGVGLILGVLGACGAGLWALLR
ncbi:MAG TPA: hypothetical protein VIU64_12960 [Polyangia bacterium]